MAATDIEGAQSGARFVSPRDGLMALHSRVPWLAGVVAVLAVLVASLLVWGPEMGFPTTLSESEAPTSSDRTVTLQRTVRGATGDTIDNAVDWLTDEGDWLFDGVSDAIVYTLLNIEDALKWVPWPAIIVALGLLAFAVGRWTLLGFTAVSLLYIGFMDLWPNAIDTIALILVAVIISLAIGLPLGVFGARNRMGDNVMRPILDAMQTMPSFVLPAARDPLLRAGQAGRDLRHRHLRRASGHPADEPRHPPGVTGGSRGRPRLRVVPVAGADEGPDPDGAADDHGGHQPDHAHGSGDGHGRQHGGCRGSGR